MTRPFSFANVIASTEGRNEARRAALLLHAVPLADQEWLLARLPVAKRAAMQQLLAELRELGIPAARDVLLDVLAAAPSSSEGDCGGSHPDAIELELDRADDGALARVLEREPVELIVKLLALRSWRWQAALLARLGDTKRHAVEKCLRQRSNLGSGRLERPGDATSRTSADSCLLDLLHRRLKAAVAVSDEPLDPVHPVGRPSPRRTRPSRWWEFSHMRIRARKVR